MSHEIIRNPHLEGDTFFWEGGPVGVLLIHGYTATTAEVRLLGRFLHERGYTVSGPLLPGHGTTPQAMNRCRWQDWTGAVEQAYRQISTRCDRVFVRARIARTTWCHLDGSPPCAFCPHDLQAA
ncbi:MAG: uncharacterized protein H6R36_398 [Chloroflexi bacterium]|nr:uncharacterized protein [Chloroflexota bacterium]